MIINLRVWRQANAQSAGKMVSYRVEGVSEDMSFLEMLDLLNEDLTVKGEEPIAFDHDCREGICGMCGVVINGTAHGRGNSPVPTTTCQLHMRSFADGATIDVEPWRAGAFPVIKDLVVDRTAFDRIIQAGGFISINAGSAPEAHSVPAPKIQADERRWSLGAEGRVPRFAQRLVSLVCWPIRASSCHHSSTGVPLGSRCLICARRAANSF